MTRSGVCARMRPSGDLNEPLPLRRIPSLLPLLPFHGFQGNNVFVKRPVAGDAPAAEVTVFDGVLGGDVWIRY